MYYIYKIAYKISDEIKAQKDAEKPFYWEHIHPSVRELSIEDIEKRMLEGGTPAEKIAEMTKNEKYLAISEGCYVVDCQKAEAVNAELESLKKEVERSKTSFINQPPASPVQTQPEHEETLEPIEFGKKPVSSIPSPIPSDNNGLNDIVPAVKADEGNIGGIPPLETPQPAAGGAGDPLSAPISSGGGGFGGSSAPKNSAELRRHAQSIAGRVVADINSKADSIPDDVSTLKEQDLLQAVIDELKHNTK